MKFRFIILLFLTSHYLFGQVVFQDKNITSDSVELQKLYSESLKIWDSIGAIGFNILRMDILEIKNQKYLLPEGRFDVYKWNGLNWKNIYIGGHHGYNYKSKKFVFNNELFSFGGYGFWKRHGQLIKFLPNRGEWELLPCTKSQKSGIAFTSPNGLNVFGESDYRIDIKKKQIVTLPSLKYEIKDDLYRTMNIFNYEFENYAIVYHPPILLFNKKTGKEYQSELSPFISLGSALQNKYLIHIIHDSIVLYDKDMIIIESTSVSKEMDNFTPIRLTTIGWLKSKWMNIMLFIFLISISLYFYKKKKKHIEFENPLISKLNPSIGKILKQEELDEILGISDIKNSDTHRGRRSIILDEINSETKSKTGKKLILRIKDPEDGRRFLYEIVNPS